MIKRDNETELVDHKYMIIEYPSEKIHGIASNEGRNSEIHAKLDYTDPESKLRRREGGREGAKMIGNGIRRR